MYDKIKWFWKYYKNYKYVLAVLILSAWGCFALADKLAGYLKSTYLAFGIPLGLFLLLGWISFWLVNRPRSADFLIATEGEMKKVSWSSKKEIVGSTKVVIVTTFILAALLFLVDFVFATMFKVMGITG